MMNYIKRGMYFIADNGISATDRKEIIDEFTNCAYCGKKVDEPQYDHVVPGKGNGKYNRVLSCKFCNSYSKRDKDWKEYLKNICKDEETYQDRSKKISNWIDKNQYNENKEIKEIVEKSMAEIRRIIETNKITIGNAFNSKAIRRKV